MLENLIHAPIQTFAACSNTTSFLGLEPWYRYLTVKSQSVGGTSICSIQFPTDPKSVLGAHSPFLLIGLAVVDDLLRIAALIAVGYVIFGGIQYQTSQGAPDATKKAQQTIINALVGLVLAILAASIVGFIGGQLGG